MKRIIKMFMIGACAVFAEMSYGASSVVDELGYVPTHWYRFAVGARSLGSSDITWGTAPVGTVDADLEGVFGAVGPQTGHAGTGTKLKGT